MGKKGWLYALSCVVNQESDDKKNNKKNQKSLRSFWKQKSRGIDSPEDAEIAAVSPTLPSPKVGVEWVCPEIEDTRYGYTMTEAENEDGAAAEPASEVVQLATVTVSPVKSEEEIAAPKIQSVFRGYMARRSFRAVKGLMRLERLVLGQSVKRQATTTLSYMQTMARVQRQVGARRIRMSEENQALERQRQQMHDLEKSKTSQVGQDWDGSTKSKEQVDADRIRQQQAAIIRERTMAYAYTHQQTWRNSHKHATQNLMDPHTSQWGWNWLEKWMAARPWENKTIEEELSSEPPSAKSVATLAQKARRDLNLDPVKSSKSPRKQTRTPGRLSVSSSRTTTPKSASMGRARTPLSSSRSVSSMDDDDSRSTQSARSGRLRSHSGAGSTRDDESQANSATPPSYMSRTSSAKSKATRDDESQTSSATPLSHLSRTSSAKSKGTRDDESQTSLATPRSYMSRTSSAKAKSRSSVEKNIVPEKQSVFSEKKTSRSPSQRRHSEPLKTPEAH